jgi:hypothetical protein
MLLPAVHAAPVPVVVQDSGLLATCLSQLPVVLALEQLLPGLLHAVSEQEGLALQIPSVIGWQKVFAVWPPISACKSLSAIGLNAAAVCTCGTKMQQQVTTVQVAAHVSFHSLF